MTNIVLLTMNRDQSTLFFNYSFMFQLLCCLIIVFSFIFYYKMKKGNKLLEKRINHLEKVIKENKKSN